MEGRRGISLKSRLTGATGRAPDGSGQTGMPTLSNDRSIVNVGRDYILNVVLSGSRQAGRSKKPAYFAGFFAAFFFAFGFGTCGAGGVFNIRRTIFSNEGGSPSNFAFMVSV